MQKQEVSSMSNGCPAGFKMVNGQCVPEDTKSTPEIPDRYKTLSGELASYQHAINKTPEELETEAQQSALSKIYDEEQQAYKGIVQQNIKSSEENLQLQRDLYNKQLAEQRQDYLKNRQALQKDTFMRGRNLLANLSNRGLATSGLQQLGDVQRTIATGQQMSGLSEAFSKARDNITQQLSAAETTHRQFAGQQEAGLAASIAASEKEKHGALQRDSERTLSLQESLIAALQTPGLSDEQKSQLTNIYTTAMGGGGTTTPATGGATGETTDGTLAGAFGTTGGEGVGTYQMQADTYFTGDYSANKAKASEEFQNSWAKGENNPLFNEESAEYQTLETNGGRISGYTRSSSPNLLGGFNDTFTVITPDGGSISGTGGQIAAAIMAGRIKIDINDPNQAELLWDIAKVGGAGTSIGTNKNVHTGDVAKSLRWNSVIEGFLGYLNEQGLITGSGDDVRASQKWVDALNK